MDLADTTAALAALVDITADPVVPDLAVTITVLLWAVAGITDPRWAAVGTVLPTAVVAVVACSL